MGTNFSSVSSAPFICNRITSDFFFVNNRTIVTLKFLLTGRTMQKEENILSIFWLSVADKVEVVQWQIALYSSLRTLDRIVSTTIHRHTNSYNSLFVCLSVYLPVCLFVYSSFCLSVGLSVCLSVYICLCFYFEEVTELAKQGSKSGSDGGRWKWELSWKNGKWKRVKVGSEDGNWK